jgi:hypothetical protein
LLFANPTHKTKVGTANGWETTKTTHLEQSNYLANQKQGAVNKYDLTVFIRFFQGSTEALEDVHFSKVIAVFEWIHWI